MFNYISWSIVTIATAASTNFTGLIICRVLLGVFESTVLPCCILLTQMWWTRREQSYRTMAYLIASSSAAIFAPLMAYGIGHVSQTLKPYQGIFIFIGGVSCFFVPLIWFLLPNGPTTARFLNKGNDRLIALERVRENNTGTKVGLSLGEHI
jgi:MFS family permease